MARQPRRLMRLGVADLVTQAQFDAYIGPYGELVAAPDGLRLHDGSTPGGIPIGGGGTSLVGSQPEATLASAATVNIGASLLARIAITGTAAITSFGAVANRIRLLRFTGAATLTHNAASLILPGGANIVAAAGDTAIAVSDASGNWRVFGYQRADGASSPAVLTKIDVITSTQNYSVPTWAKFVDIIMIGGGGGGGSGRKGAGASGRGGGGGGGAGGYVYGSFVTSELVSTLYVEVGAGGAGGAAISADNTNGNPGQEGGNTNLFSGGNRILTAPRGLGGSGGTTGVASGGLSGATITLDFGSGGGGAGAAGPGGGAQNGLQAAGGAGGGGGITAGDVPGNGGGSGFSCLIGRTTNAASAGVAPGGSGGDGFAKPWSRGFGGSGGGGAGGNAAGTVAGGNGGAGAPCGGAGGGGGGATNGANSGAGGAGGRGEVWIIARG